MKLLACGFWLALAALPLGSCQFPSYQVRSEIGTAGEDDGGAAPGGAGARPTAGDGGAGGTGGNGGSVSPPLCGNNGVCQPAAPNGWLGPVAFYIGPSDVELPTCPEGYGDPTDLHADPEGDPLGCECTCTPVDQRCDSPDRVRLFNNLNCNDRCADASSEECTSITTCSGNENSISARVTPPIGTCEPNVVETPGTTRWGRDARLCEPDGEVDECGAAASCYPIPLDPFVSQLCVYRVVLEGQAPPDCPGAYPRGPELLYSTLEDQRQCGACRCQDLRGGSCAGQVTINSADCGQAAPSTYTIGAGCQPVRGVKTVVTHYEMTPGTCSVAEEPVTVGDIVPAGRYRAVCCL